MTFRKLFPALLIAAAVVCVMTAAYKPSGPVPYHNHDEVVQMRILMQELPVGVNSVFAGSGKCGGCHGDDPVDYANVNSEGIDVNPTDNWRGTMMANSSKDPFWRAKVSHEVALYPEHQEIIEDKCTSCHAPLGKFAALHDGIPHYSIEMLTTDSLALDGVSCGACHQQQIETMGDLFSGQLTYNPDTIWGPYVSDEEPFPIFSSAMSSFVGFEPVGHNSFEESEACATCHTLLTETVDFAGNFTGTQFVEQATYHEWLNSSFNNDPNMSEQCQGCHMPRLEEEIVIASGYAFLEGRTPYGQHWLTGGNSFMLELLKNNIETLGLTANEEQFDRVIDRTLEMLSTQTATVSITEENVDGDTATYKVKLTNLAGHKFPSGYPSRRAYIEFTVRDDDDNILWQSGGLQPDYEVFGQNPDYEPHYQVIDEQEEVQIYEMVMGDVNGDVTTVLVRANAPIKDNRIAPLGFSSEHLSYDTMLVAGIGTDPDFNMENGVEGSGTDEIYYHVPVTGYDGTIFVTARLMYQSVPPKWNNEMFSVNTPEIDLFEPMYVAEGADPVQVGEDQVQSVIVSTTARVFGELFVYPNPTSDGVVRFYGGQFPVSHIDVYNTEGQRIQRVMINAQAGKILLPQSRGTYLLEIHSADGTVAVEKIIRR